MVQPPAVTIRAATPEDAHSVAQVHVDSWRHAYRGLLPDDYLDALSVEDREAMWLGAFSDPAARTGAFVAEAEGRVVGFASFGPTRDEDARNGTGGDPGDLCRAVGPWHGRWQGTARRGDRRAA